jgi:hypothetical protein
MVTTNFPQGVTSFGTLVIGGNLPLVPDGGNYWFVDSATGSAGNLGTYDSPFASITTAITAAAANDCIVLAAGPAETVVAAAGVTVSKSVQIIGFGTGSTRPTFTFSTSVSASWLISAAGVNVQNIIGVSGVDQLTQPFDVRAAGVTLNIEWQDSASNVEAVRAILTTAAADRLNVTLRYLGQTGGSHCVNAVRLIGVDTAIINCDFYGKASTSWVEFATTACTDIEVYGYMYNSGTTNGSKNVVDTVTGSTWYASFSDGAGGKSYSGGSAAALSVNGSVGEAVAFKAAATMTNGQTLFTITGGPVRIIALASVCVTGNDATASTLQYSVTPTSGSAQTISGASSSLANAAAGASVTLAGTALATAALYNANGPNLMANPGTIFAPAGTLTAVIGTGSTTGTWAHYIRYAPLATGAVVA